MEKLKALIDIGKRGPQMVVMEYKGGRVRFKHDFWVSDYSNWMNGAMD